MAVYIIDVLASNIEQGSIGPNGDFADSSRVRCIGYLPFLGTEDGKVQMSATATTSKTIQVDLLGYTSNTTTSPSFDFYWYDSPREFDISSYSDVKYLRIVLKYADGSTLVPSEVASCIITYEYVYPWEMEGDYPVPTKSLQAITDRFVKPYPASLWRIDESNDGYPYNELMPDILYRDPIPPPEPDNPERANWLSHWFIRLGDIDINKKSVMGYISQKADRTFQPANFKNSPHWNNSVQELNDIYYKMLGIDSVGGLIEWNYIEGGET